MLNRHGAGIVQADYLIYKDAGDANNIKALDGRTGIVSFTHSRDFGYIFNFGALPASGGMISIQAGTYDTETTLTIKDYATVKGAGMSVTRIRLANCLRSRNNAIGIDGAYPAHVSNIVMGHIVNLSGHSAISVTHDMSANTMLIYSVGTGTNFKMGEILSVMSSNGAKWGAHQGQADILADGILSSLTSVGTGSAVMEQSNGIGRRFTTAETNGGNAGLRLHTQVTMRAWNPNPFNLSRNVSGSASTEII